MSAIKARIKSQHAEKVLAALDKLRAWDWICDFTIQVGSESFPVHRTVLASCSEYFFELFKRNGIEVEKGGIEIEGLDASTVKLCIEFMYTGTADITLENADHILLAASNFKLSDLTELCLEFLIKNISVSNCLYVKSLCEKYNYTDKKEDMENFIAKKFDELILTRDFLSLRKDDVLLYLGLPGIDHKSLWEGVASWVMFRVDERRKFYFEFLSLNFAKFPVEFLLDTVWPNRLTKESKPCRDLVVNVILSSIEKLKEGITLKNCFILRDLCTTYQHANSKEAHNQVGLFLMKSFEKVANRDEIVYLSRDEIFEIFQSPKTKYSSEETKWEVAVKWTKHNLLRKKYFTDLFAVIKLENLTLDFIEDVVRTEPLVKDSAKCNNILMNALITHARHEKSEKTETTPKKRITKESDTKPKTPDLKSSPLPKKIRKVMKKPHKISTGLTSSESSTSDADILSSDTAYLAVYDSGRVKGLNLDKIKWKDLAVAKVTKDDFQGTASVENKLYLLQGNLMQALEKTGWVKVSSKPSKPNAEARMLAFQSSIYVIQDGCSSVYDVEENRWEENRSFFSPGQGFCVCATDMFIYILGGSTNPTATRKYDPLSGGVSSVSPQSIPRKDAACASLKGKIYVMGGIVDGSPSMTVDSYDEQADLWSVVPNMQVKRSNFCVYTFCNKIYAVGGTNDGDQFDSVEVYELQKNKYSWRVLHKMMKPKSKITACVIKMASD